MLAHDLARVEVAQLEVGVLGAELGPQLVAGAVGQAAHASDHLPGLAGELRQLVGAEDQDRDERDDRELRQADPEHAAGPRTCWSA